jgi:hypothetical protein
MILSNYNLFNIKCLVNQKDLNCHIIVVTIDLLRCRLLKKMNLRIL